MSWKDRIRELADNHSDVTLFLTSGRELNGTLQRDGDGQVVLADSAGEIWFNFESIEAIRVAGSVTAPAVPPPAPVSAPEASVDLPHELEEFQTALTGALGTVITGELDVGGIPEDPNAPSALRELIQATADRLIAISREGEGRSRVNNSIRGVRFGHFRSLDVMLSQGTLLVNAPLDQADRAGSLDHLQARIERMI